MTVYSYAIDNTKQHKVYQESYTQRDGLIYFIWLQLQLQLVNFIRFITYKNNFIYTLSNPLS